MLVSPLKLTILATILASLFLAGCATKVAEYRGSELNASAVRASADIGIFKFGEVRSSKNQYPIVLRKRDIVSPVGDGFGDYIEAAFRKDLALAGKLNDAASLTLTGVLLKNDLDALSGDGIVEVVFTLTNQGVIAYSEVVIVNHSWTSNLVGSIAVERATTQYSVMTEILVGKLFTDPKFLNAIR